MSETAINDTMRKFGYPDTLLREYDAWAVLLRPGQVTAGCLVLVSRLPARSLADLPPEAFAELTRVTGDLEQALRTALAFDKINYLLLMMVDPDVHFHVIPRYETPREVAGVAFVDEDWPKPPKLKRTTPLTGEQRAALHELIASSWPT